MWAYEVTHPRRLNRTTVAVPVEADLQPGEVLLKVEAGGICGSDLVYFEGGWPRPTQLGTSPTDRYLGGPMHEVAGVVLATRDQELRVGARVVGWASGFNGLSEQVITSGDGVVEYDPAMSASDAITLQPLACVLEAVDRLPDLDGKTVTVLGLGPIGLLFCHVAKTRGAARVIGVDQVDRSDVATAFGVDELAWHRSDRLSAIANGSADVVVETVGHQTSTFRDAIELAAHNGTVYYFGVPDDEYYTFPMVEFFRKNLTLISGVTDDRKRALHMATRYLADHQRLVRDYVTHVMPVDLAQSGFELASHPKPGQLKIVLRFR